MARKKITASVGVECISVDPGDPFEGVYVESSQVETKKHGLRTYHVFRLEGGDIYGIWGMTHLDALIAKCVPGLMTYLRHTEQVVGDREMHVWECEQDVPDDDVPF